MKMTERKWVQRFEYPVFNVCVLFFIKNVTFYYFYLHKSEYSLCENNILVYSRKTINKLNKNFSYEINIQSKNILICWRDL